MTTGVTLFFTNKGYHPNITIYPKWELASAKACEYIVDLDELHTELCSEMAKAQAYYQGPTENPHLTSRLDNKSLLGPKTSKLLDPPKSFWKISRSYDIIAQPGTHSFTLQLPKHLHDIHPVFHVSQLEPSVPNTIPNRTQPPPPPVKINDDLKYEITKSSTLSWIIGIGANSFTMSNGQVMKALMKRTLGYRLQN